MISDLNEAVPLQEDLPGYAAGLFDYLMARPETVRMIAWRRLERPQACPGLSDTYVGQMMQVRDRSDPAAIEAVDLVVGLANAWHLSSSDLLAAAGQDAADPRRIALHRSAVVEATRRISGTP